MVEFKNIENGYKDIYQPILDQINRDFYNQEVDYQIYQTDMQEGIIGITNNVAMFYYYDTDHTIKHHYANFDENFNLTAFSTDEGNLTFLEEMWFLTNPNGMINAINLVPDATLNNGFNSHVAFCQLDRFRHMSVNLYYYHLKNNENDKINPLYIRTPHKVLIQKGLIPHRKTYELKDIDYNDPYYNLVTIKEYGMKNTMEQTAYGLQHQPSISRYFRVFFPLGMHQGIELFPLSKHYKIEDLYREINLLGFTTTVDDTIIKVYNGQYQPLNFYGEILQSAMNKKGYTRTLKKDER